MHKSAIHLFTLFSSVALCCAPLSGAEPETVAPDHHEGRKASLTLADLESIAESNNPTLAQAAAVIDASRGSALQAGLYPNPIIGYQGEQIGAEGTAGELQGIFIEQQFITAGKLRLSRAKYQQEAVMAEIQAMAQRYRVLNSVRLHFWDALTAQQLVVARRDLLGIAENAAGTTEQLVNVGQANRPDLLQAQIEVQRARVQLRNAQQHYQGQLAQLAAVAGRPDLCAVSLAGRLDVEGPAPDWDKTLCDLLAASPEMQLAHAEVSRDQITVERERVEPVPNVAAQVATGYNYETRNSVANVSIGLNIPLFDRNQGTIQQAQADLARAEANVARVELSLRRRFADAATRYSTARVSVDDYRQATLPKAKEAYELLQANFQDRRAAWPQVLVANRNYVEFIVDYLESLRELRRAEVEIKGLLLVDGLEEPPGPTPQGHIDAVPKPR